MPLWPLYNIIPEPVILLSNAMQSIALLRVDEVEGTPVSI